MLEPLVRYVVARNKSEIDIQAQLEGLDRSASRGRENSTSRGRGNSQKAVSFQKPIIETMQANSKIMLSKIAAKASEM